MSTDIKDFFNQEAKKRSKWIKKNRYYYKLLQNYLRFIVPPNSKVLEIGCGTGELLNALAPSVGVGIDISSEMIRIAKYQFPHQNFIEADAHSITLEDKFQYIIISDTVGYFHDIQSVFSGLHKVSTDETRIIITYYNYLWYGILRLGEILHIKMKEPAKSWLALEDIRNLLDLSGFEVIRKFYKILFPKYIPLVSAFCNKVLANLSFFWKLSLTEIVIARPRQNTKRDCTVSVIIPCRNEEGNIAGVVERTPQMGIKTELVFVDGHSTDGTVAEIQRQIQIHPEKDIKLYIQDGKGKGDAVRKGFAHATGEALMILDADLTVPPEDLPKFYDAITEGRGEFLNGCRFVYPMEDRAMRLLNTLGNKFFSRAFTYLLEQRFKDTLCGTKVLLKSNYEKLNANRSYFGDFDPFGDFDLIFGAIKLNLKVVEIPIRYRERMYGETNISRFRDGWLLLKMCVFALRKIKWI